MPLYHPLEPARRLHELPRAEQQMSMADRQLGDEVVGGKKALDAVAFLACRINDERGRRPLRTELLAKAGELVLLLAHVHAHRYEVFVDEL